MAKDQVFDTNFKCNFPVPDFTSMADDIKDTLRQRVSKGFINPRLPLVFARRPDELRAMLRQGEQAFKPSGNLTRADKEMIGVAVSSANNCNFCMIGHTVRHMRASGDHHLARKVATDWRSSGMGPREKAILEFAFDVHEVKRLDESHFEKLAENGLTKEDAWDIGRIVSIFASANRMVNMAGFDQDDGTMEMWRSSAIEKETN